MARLGLAAHSKRKTNGRGEGSNESGDGTGVQRHELRAAGGRGARRRLAAAQSWRPGEAQAGAGREQSGGMCFRAGVAVRRAVLVEVRAQSHIERGKLRASTTTRQRVWEAKRKSPTRHAGETEQIHGPGCLRARRHQQRAGRAGTRGARSESEEWMWLRAEWVRAGESGGLIDGRCRPR